jgi:hypothetical protein
MKAKREIKGKEFIIDLQSGFSAVELMEKYNLSADGLRKIFKAILDVSAMKKSEMEALPNLYRGPMGEARIRRFPRKRVASRMWIYEGIDQVQGGEVFDVSEQGIRTKGLRIRPGEKRIFIARPVNKGQGRPFVFEGVCRWADNTDLDPTKWMAGLEITRISGVDAEAFQELLLR